MSSSEARRALGSTLVVLWHVLVLVLQVPLVIAAGFVTPDWVCGWFLKPQFNHVQPQPRTRLLKEPFNPNIISP